MSRNLLHKTKLEEFKTWLDAEGLPHRPGKGEWQVLQVCKDGKHWNSVFIRINMPEHLTTDRQIDGLVKKFCQQRIKAPNAEFRPTAALSPVAPGTTSSGSGGSERG